MRILMPVNVCGPPKCCRSTDDGKCIYLTFRNGSTRMGDICQPVCTLFHGEVLKQDEDERIMKCTPCLEACAMADNLDKACSERSVS